MNDKVSLTLLRMLEILKKGWETRLAEFWISDTGEAEVVDILNRKRKGIAKLNFLKQIKTSIKLRKKC